MLPDTDVRSPVLPGQSFTHRKTGYWWMLLQQDLHHIIPRAITIPSDTATPLLAMAIA
jgi:hypothetical protein